MESKGIPPPARVYQDFEPSTKWETEDDSDTLVVYLHGFAKEQLRVQLRSRNLIISGERELQLDKWSRFRVKFPVSANCDFNKISAKFEGNVLYVRQPKKWLPAIAAALVGVFATKLKTSRNAVNTIVILLIGLVIGVYVSSSFKSWMKV